MSTLQIDFEFEFARTSPKYQIVLDLNALYPNDKHLRMLKKIALDCNDLTDEESLEETGWEIDDYLQHDLIMPKTEVSNFVIEKSAGAHNGHKVGDVSFDVELDLWGTVFKVRDFMEQDSNKPLTEDSTDREFEQEISNYYYGTHHNFDILEIELTYIP